MRSANVYNIHKLDYIYVCMYACMSGREVWLDLTPRQSVS
jgi:hypothetical protein